MPLSWNTQLPPQHTMWTISRLLPNCAGGYFKLWPLKGKKKKKRKEKKEEKEEEEPQAASVPIANGWAMSFLQALWFCTWLTSNSGSEPCSWWLSALVDCLTSSTGESAIYLCAPISSANWGTKSAYISIIFFSFQLSTTTLGTARGHGRREGVHLFFKHVNRAPKGLSEGTYRKA